MRASLGILSTPEIGGGGGGLTITERLDARTVANTGQASGDFTSSSFTTVASSLLVALVAVDNQFQPLTQSHVPTPTTSGTTWSLVDTAFNTGANNSAHAFIYKADSPGAGSSNTFAMSGANTWDTQVNIVDVVILEFTGALAASSQTKACAKATSFSGTPRDPGAQTITLPAAPSASSYVLGLLAADCDSGITTSPGTSPAAWTELSDRPSVPGSEHWGHSQSQYITGSTSTSVHWADLASAANMYDYALIGWEVLAA